MNTCELELQRDNQFHQIVDELKKLDDCPVECDGFVRLAAKVLTRHEQEFQSFIGSVSALNGSSFPTHLWIVWGEFIIDYRARMWLGEKAQHGLLDRLKHAHLYIGEPVAIEMPSDGLEAILKMEFSLAPDTI